MQNRELNVISKELEKFGYFYTEMVKRKVIFKTDYVLAS